MTKKSPDNTCWWRSDGEGEEGKTRRRSDILDSLEGNKKQQVRKKKNQAGMEKEEEEAAVFMRDRCRDWLLNSAGAGMT